MTPHIGTNAFHVLVTIYQLFNRSEIDCVVLSVCLQSNIDPFGTSMLCGVDVTTAERPLMLHPIMICWL